MFALAIRQRSGWISIRGYARPQRRGSLRVQGFRWHSTDTTQYNSPLQEFTGVGAIARLLETTHLTMREGITMKRRSVVVMGVLLVGLTVFWHVHEAPGQGSGGWITLFDGKNLDNWSRLGEANWTIADGVVQADKKV